MTQQTDADELLVTINLQKIESGWMADIEELPGSPPIGTGRTKAEAVSHLFLRLITKHPEYLKYIQPCESLKLVVKNDPTNLHP